MPAMRKKEKSITGGISEVIKRKNKKGGDGLKGSGLYGEWLIDDEIRTGVKKPRRSKRSMKDLKKGSGEKAITHSRMNRSKKEGNKMDQWTKYYK